MVGEFHLYSEVGISEFQAGKIQRELPLKSDFQFGKSEESHSDFKIRDFPTCYNWNVVNLGCDVIPGSDFRGKWERSITLTEYKCFCLIKD